MRIGVDATCWQNRRGFGRHARGLLTALARIDRDNHYVFFLDAGERPDNVPPQAEVRLVSSTLPTAVAASANSHRSLADLWRMSRALSDSTLDLLLFPAIYSYVPVWGRAKKVVMIHDIIADSYPDATLPSHTAKLFWKTKTWFGRRQADAIVTVSEYSRRAVAERYRLAPERVFVVGEASDPVFRVLGDVRSTPRLESLQLPDNGPRIVYVGGFSAHKNLTPLIEVFARLVRRDDFSNTVLVMVGEYEKEVFHSHFGAIQQRVRTLGLTERVIFTGYLPDEELVILLNLSTVLVLPSLMEGFGLPAIEAAACGCPVIATKASPLEALLGDGALYVDPEKEHELELTLTRVLSSATLRQKMREAGLEAARKLTWDAAAKEMIGVMQEVMQQ
jgi:glycosyltransferase involved in cell wall biosynthesis